MPTREEKIAAADEAFWAWDRGKNDERSIGEAIVDSLDALAALEPQWISVNSREFVYLRYPSSTAISRPLAGDWYISASDGGDKLLGFGDTQQSAWDDAARRLAAPPAGQEEKP